MGLGFKGNTGRFHSIGENASGLKKHFEFNSRTGYFGERGDSGRSSVRIIRSQDPVRIAEKFYDEAAYGGKEKRLSNGKGVMTVMKDGSVLTFRRVSTSDGSPAVDINISARSTDDGGIKTQKIHFERGMT